MPILTTLVDIFFRLCSFLKCLHKDVKNEIFVTHFVADDITIDDKSYRWYSAMYILYILTTQVEIGMFC